MFNRFKTFDPQPEVKVALDESVSLTDKAKLSLYKKSQQSGYSTDILEEVYRRGFTIWNEDFGGTPEQFGFDRVNSFIAGGFAADLDTDLLEGKFKNMMKVASIAGAMAGPAYDTYNIATHPHDPLLPATSAAAYLNPAAKGLKVAGNMIAPALKIDQAGKGENELHRQKKFGVVLRKKVNESDAETHSKDFTKPASRFDGSDELVDIYKKQTPGQTIKKIVKEVVGAEESSINETSKFKKIKYALKAVPQQLRIAKELPPDDVEKDKTYQKRTKGIKRLMGEDNE